jgi:hypothetical protein
VKKSAADYQATRRAKVKASGDVFLHVQVSPETKDKLQFLCSKFKFTRRQMVEMLINGGIKRMPSYNIPSSIVGEPVTPPHDGESVADYRVRAYRDILSRT